MNEKLNGEILESLLERFNKRDASAFAVVYTNFFAELHAYAFRLYEKTATAPEDVVQDAFFYLWERREVTFDNLLRIKVFLIVVIKNKYYHYLNHLGVVSKYKEAIEHEHRFVDDIFYCEQVAFLIESVERIPNIGRKVIKLYLDGYEAEDIAEKMQMSIQTIYNIKSQAIQILKKYFSKENRIPKS